MSERDENQYAATSETYDQAYQNNMGQPMEMETEKKGNVVLGILGAFIGAAIGGGLWIIVTRFGYIAGIVGFIIILLSFKGYELLSGKLDKTGAIVALIFSIASIFIAECLAIAIEYHTSINEYTNYPFSKSFSDTMDLIKTQGEMTRAFLKDIVIGYAFTIAASFTLIRNALKGEK